MTEIEGDGAPQSTPSPSISVQILSVTNSPTCRYLYCRNYHREMTRQGWVRFGWDPLRLLLLVGATRWLPFPGEAKLHGSLQQNGDKKTTLPGWGGQPGRVVRLLSRKFGKNASFFIAILKIVNPLLPGS
jgi:hypothetical protein